MNADNWLWLTLPLSIHPRALPTTDFRCTHRTHIQMASPRFQLSAIKCVVWLHAQHVKCLLMMCRFDWLDRLTMIGYGSGNLSLAEWSPARFSDSTVTRIRIRIVDIGRWNVGKIGREKCLSTDSEETTRNIGDECTDGYFWESFAILMGTQLHTCWHHQRTADRDREW